MSFQAPTFSPGDTAIRRDLFGSWSTSSTTILKSKREFKALDGDTVFPPDWRLVVWFDAIFDDYHCGTGIGKGIGPRSVSMTSEDESLIIREGGNMKSPGRKKSPTSRPESRATLVSASRSSFDGTKRTETQKAAS